MHNLTSLFKKKRGEWGAAHIQAYVNVRTTHNYECPIKSYSTGRAARAAPRDATPPGVGGHYIPGHAK